MKEGLATELKTGANVIDLTQASWLTEEAKEFAQAVADEGSLSGRALMGSVLVARTIADLEECESVEAEHLAEAFGLRMSEGIGGH